MEDKIEETLKKTLSGLKPFQLATVNHCIKRFADKQSKILVADEVGLGKTLVATGVIAELYRQHRKEQSHKTFKVIYVCSNQAIAKQNIKKLNIFASLGEEAHSVIESNKKQDRITLLAYDYEVKPNEFHCSIKAITPDTSFNTNTFGKKEERHLLYRLLSPKFPQNEFALSRFIRGNKMGELKNWEKDIREANQVDKTKVWTENHPKINKDIRRKYLELLKDELPNEVIEDLNREEHLNIRQGVSIMNSLKAILKDNKYFHLSKYKGDGFYKTYSKLVKLLRYKLAEACTTLMDADLFILDEFQRFNQLLEYNENSEAENDGLALGQKILRNNKNKVLMLSATPFKPFSTDYDETNGEHHNIEFDKVISFLSGNDEEKRYNGLDKINKLKNNFFEYLRHPDFSGDRLEEATVIRKRLEEEYKNFMCRTERSLAIKDSNELVEESLHSLKVNESDIKDFVILDRIIKYLSDQGIRLTSPIEFSKSTPFALSFLKDYVHWKRLVTYYKIDTGKELKKLIAHSGDAWLNRTSINAYKPIIPSIGESLPNAKLRALQGEMKQGYDYLWIPASLPYYDPYGPYEKTNKTSENIEVADSYTKILIFSSWRMVPKMISGILSYEADRLSLKKMQVTRNEENIVPYFLNKGKKRYPKRRLRVFQSKKDYSGKNNEILSIPSAFLGNLYDPQENLTDQLSINRLKKHIKQKIKDLHPIQTWNEFPDNTIGGNSIMWSWLGYHMIDNLDSHSVGNIRDSWATTQFRDDKRYKALFSSREFKGIKEEIKKWKEDASRLNEENYEDLLDNLVTHCLGNPSICSFRALKKLFPETPESELLLAAHTIGLGFLTFFDKQETIAIVDLAVKDEKDYYSKILDYCIAGNLQSVLDEYFYMLVDSGGINSPLALAGVVKDLLTIRVGQSNFETLDSFKAHTKNQKDKNYSFRTSFARNFGDKKAGVEGTTREINLREAFNSPFRPFILASTSIGQEGLDFHYYSHKIMHWNLPYNPIDLEQREGRINRYKGHVIRKNIVDHLKASEFEIFNKNASPWQQIFDLVEERGKSRTGLIPFWYYNNLKYKIQRIVPLHPFSKDAERYFRLLKVLKYYRLTFGQPSQSVLVEMLSKQNLTPEQQKDLMINLAPEIEY